MADYGKCPEFPADTAASMACDLRQSCEQDYQDAAQWGWDRAHAAMAQRLADTDALQAAADAELEACCEFLDAELSKYGGFMRLVPALRAARRPPVPSARDAAIEALRKQLAIRAGINSYGAAAMELALRALEGGDGQ